jgi:hypothetical protein
MTEQVVEQVVEDVVELTEAEVDAVGGGWGNLRPF